LANGLVARRDGYHSANVDEQSCTDLGTQLWSERLFPIPTDQDFQESGDPVGASKTGYVYVYFFYGYLLENKNRGTGVNAGVKVPANNRCFKLWAGELVNGVVVDASLNPPQGINLNTLKCYGF
jgi:hypothetical protein